MKKILLSFVAILAMTLGVYAQFTEQATGFSAASRGIRNIVAIDDQVVWAAAYDGSGGAAPCEDITITTNGGTLWTPHTIPGIANLDIANITAVNAQKAWTCMFPPAATTTGQGIYYTSDGGATWTRQATATFSAAASFADVVYFWDQNLGYCMGDPINGEFEIYTTDDGGTTWTLVPAANIPNPVSGEFGVVGYFASYGDITWFGTNKGRVYKSIDNGHNWTVSTIPGWSAIYVFPYFMDELNGFAGDRSTAGNGLLAKTTDGGATWTTLTTTGNVFTNDMSYVPGTPNTWVTSGAASGFTGVTYSFDNCATWNDMGPTIGTQFLSMAWVNDSTGWVGGFSVDATTGGMNKFNSILAPGDFTADNVAIVKGGTVNYTITQGAHSSSTVQWTLPGGTPATSSQRHPAVVYNTPGTYNVTLKVTNSWGVTTKVKTGYIYVGGVGMNDLSAVNVSVFPNPVNGVLNIQASVNVQEVKIMSMTGQVVYTQATDASDLTINTSDLRSGVYNLQIKTASGVVNKKIVVN
jgi:hypothetical protein